MAFPINNDCLRLVMKMLDDSGKIKLALASQKLYSFIEDSCIFKSVLTFTYTSDDKLDYKYDTDKENDFLQVMRLSADVVKEISVNYIKISHLMELKDLRFPKLTKLSLGVTEDTDSYRTVELIKKMFPNMISFSVRAPKTTAKHFWRLRQLKELEICNHSIQWTTFWNIFSAMSLKKLTIHASDFDYCDVIISRGKAIFRCKTIEDLCLDIHYAYTLKNCLHKLPNLQRLAFIVKENYECEHSPSDYMLNFSKHFSEHVISIAFNQFNIKTFGFWKEFIQSMKSVKCLTFFNAVCESENLKQFAETINENLEKFYFIQSITTEDNYDALYNILEKCVNLTVFDISECKFRREFFIKAIEIVEKTLKSKKRTKPLTIRCYRTVISEEDLEHIQIPEFINIEFEDKLLQLPEPTTIRFELKVPDLCIPIQPVSTWQLQSNTSHSHISPSIVEDRLEEMISKLNNLEANLSALSFDTQCLKDRVIALRNSSNASIAKDAAIKQLQIFNSNIEQRQPIIESIRKELQELPRIEENSETPDIIIYGVPYDENKTLLEIFEILCYQLNCSNIIPTKIYRLEHHTGNESRKSAVIVHLKSPIEKDIILKAAARFRRKFRLDFLLSNIGIDRPKPVYIKEYLTEQKVKILNAAWRFKKMQKLWRVKVMGGKVLIKINEGDAPIEPINLEMLNELVN